ncbi:hypothetical protein HGA34_02935 [Candidatus Falkowbacteria bacterium]|nr:hypothetical protein [Candidatus Falkowbacteria bacterium]
MPKKKKNRGKKQKKQVSHGQSMAQALEEFQRKLTIPELWEERKENYRESVEDKLSFNYRTKEQLIIKEAMLPALTFWKFIKSHVSEYEHFCYADNINERRSFLQSFLSSENRYVRLVAMIELMPIAIWRRILWRSNIDFVSYESFLRRLQPEHWLAIESNFVDLYNGQTPRILTSKEARLPEFQAESLSSGEERERWQRHISKPAWTKNMFSFDFGFNRYPGGVDNDSPVLSTVDRRRLHSSDNTKDFVVDTEFGRYMRLYRSARSNYVVFPNKTVELKTHICPGYWATILIHLMFWIVSPAMTAGLLATASSNRLPWWANVLLAIPAVITPLWLFCAGVKFSWIRFNRWIDNRAIKWIKSTSISIETFCKKHPRGTELAAGTFFSLAIGIAVFALSQLCLGVYNGVLAGAAASAYVGYKISRIGEEKTPMPMHLFIPLYTACLYLGGLLAIKWSPYLVKGLAWVAKYAVKLFTEWIPYACVQIYEFLSWLCMLAAGAFMNYVVPALKYLLIGMLSVGLFWLVALVPLALMGILYFAYCRLPKETQTNLDYLIEKVCFYSIFVIFGAMALGCIVISFLEGGSFLSGQTLAGIMVIGIISATAAFWTRMMAQEMNPEIKQLKEETYAIRGNMRLSGLFNYRYLVENRWFSPLTLEQKTELATKIDRFVVNVVPSHQEAAAIALIMRSINSFEALDKLVAAEDSFHNLYEEHRLPIIEIMLKKSVGVREAQVLYHKQREKSKKNAELGIIIAKTVFSPIYFPCMFLWWLGSKICTGLQHLLDFRRMAKAIRDFCPYIIKPEYLE